MRYDRLSLDLKGKLPAEGCDMETVTLILGLMLVVAVAASAFVAWIVARQRPAASVDLAPIAMMQQEVQGLRQELGQMTGQVAQLLQESNKVIGDRMQDTSRVVAEVSEKLGELSGATRQMLDVGKDISGLQDILRAPKTRGVLGEVLLGDLLAQMLPPDFYTLGYRFRSGEVVDAAIKLGRNLVPVDSKFPLENFRPVLAGKSEEDKAAQQKEFARDVRKHIDAIAGKYIVPDEGTYDFALMYIPAENVYYDIIVSTEALCADKTICDYALSKRVIPVSPNCFYAYLQAIALGLKGLQIEKTAKDVMAHLARLRQDLEKFRADFELVGKHIANARNKYEESERRLSRFADKLESATSAQPELAADTARELPGESTADQG